MAQIKTTKFKTDLLEPSIIPDLSSDEFRPWRIALFIRKHEMRFIINPEENHVLGRLDTSTNVVPDIDLTPFDASGLGVSRQHLTIKLEGDNVVAVDNNSANGTKLNGKKLAPAHSYPLHHGDMLLLGGLELIVEFLSNPLA